MSMVTSIDVCAPDGLRRAVLVRNALVANTRRAQQEAQAAAAAAAAARQADDDDLITLAYPWQRQRTHQQVGLAASIEPTYVAYQSDSDESLSTTSPDSSPSSSAASLLDEREQAWFDDLLSELEHEHEHDVSPALLIQDDSIPERQAVEYDDDDEELLASLTGLATASSSSSELPPSTSASLNLSSSSLDELPDLVQDFGIDEDDSDDEHDLASAPRIAVALASNASSSSPSASRSKPESTSQDVLGAQDVLPLFGRAPPSPFLEGQDHTPLKTARQESHQDAILHLLPAVYALPAARRSHLSARPASAPSIARTELEIRS